MKVCLRGAGAVGGFGCGLASLEAAMRKRPSPDSVPAAAGSHAPLHAAQTLTTETDLLDPLIPPRALRRVDHYARMALLASHMALEDARMGNGLPENTGLIVATGMGPTANTLDLQPADAAATDLALSPILFSNSVQNAAAAYISMLLKIRGPIVSINHYEMAVPLALQTAIDWLEEGRTETVLVGSIDCLSKALQEASLSGKGSENGDSRRPAYPIGEGSAFFVLTRGSAQGSQCPFVHQVLLGRKGRTVEIPVPATLILHNGPIENADGAVRPRRHANFTHLYGVFPTSMGMDVAAALLLLRTDRLLNTAVPQFAGGLALNAPPRIGCLKQGETGDWGMVVVGK